MHLHCVAHCWMTDSYGGLLISRLSPNSGAQDQKLLAPKGRKADRLRAKAGAGAGAKAGAGAGTGGASSPHVHVEGWFAKRLIPGEFVSFQARPWQCHHDARSEAGQRLRSRL